MMHSGHSLVNKKTTTEGEILDYLWTGYVTEIRCLTKCKFKQNNRKQGHHNVGHIPVEYLS